MQKSLLLDVRGWLQKMAQGLRFHCYALESVDLVRNSIKEILKMDTWYCLSVEARGTGVRSHDRTAWQLSLLKVVDHVATGTLGLAEIFC